MTARLRKFFYTMVERFHGLIARVLEDGRRTGHLKADLDSSDAAFLVIALVQGLVLRWPLRGRAFDLAAEGRRPLSVPFASLGAPEESKQAHSHGIQGRSNDRTAATAGQEG